MNVRAEFNEMPNKLTANKIITQILMARQRSPIRQARSRPIGTFWVAHARSDTTPARSSFDWASAFATGALSVRLGARRAPRGLFFPVTYEESSDTFKFIVHTNSPTLIQESGSGVSVLRSTYYLHDIGVEYVEGREISRD